MFVIYADCNAPTGDIEAESDVRTSTARQEAWRDHVDLEMPRRHLTFNHPFSFNEHHQGASIIETAAVASWQIGTLRILRRNAYHTMFMDYSGQLTSLIYPSKPLEHGLVDGKRYTRSAKGKIHWKL
jgi:hypothetical protein